MSDDTPEELKKYRSEKEDKYAEADMLGQVMAESCMKEIGSALNCLKGKHEPADLSYEGYKGFVLAGVKLCKHCKCLYVEE